MPTKFSAWSKEEDIVLSEFSKTVSIRALARRIGCTPYQIKSRAGVLGVRLNKSNGRIWTPADDKVLKDNHENMTSEQIGVLLDRGLDSVKHRARKLNLSLRKYGDKCSWAKYGNDVVEQARALHDEGMLPRKISEELNVPYWNVCDFIYYKRGVGFNPSEHGLG